LGALSVLIACLVDGMMCENSRKEGSEMDEKNMPEERPSLYDYMYD
jgi:hypothetical protein